LGHTRAPPDFACPNSDAESVPLDADAARGELDCDGFIGLMLA